MSYLSSFSPTWDPLLFQKIPCHFVASVKDNAIVNVSFQFGTILMRVSSTYKIPIFMYKYHVNSSLFGIKIEQQIFLETNKTLCKIQFALGNVNLMLGTHTTNLTSHAFAIFSFGFKV